MRDIHVPTAPGELIDKLTILRLKVENTTAIDKLVRVRLEHKKLLAIAEAALAHDGALEKLWCDLYEVNADLWSIKDDIRKCEARRDFGPAFVALARAAYATNGERAVIKKKINLLLGSATVGEKSYSTSTEDSA